MRISDWSSDVCSSDLPATICTPSPDDPEAGPDNPNCVRTSNGGNADLEPIKSQNYEASLEWYFSRGGSLTLGLYQRAVTGFISALTNDVEDRSEGWRVGRECGRTGRVRGWAEQ